MLPAASCPVPRWGTAQGCVVFPLRPKLPRPVTAPDGCAPRRPRDPGRSRAPTASSARFDALPLPSYCPCKGLRRMHLRSFGWHLHVLAPLVLPGLPVNPVTDFRRSPGRGSDGLESLVSGFVPGAPGPGPEERRSPSPSPPPPSISAMSSARSAGSWGGRVPSPSGRHGEAREGTGDARGPGGLWHVRGPVGTSVWTLRREAWCSWVSVPSTGPRPTPPSSCSSMP